MPSLLQVAKKYGAQVGMRHCRSWQLKQRTGSRQAARRLTTPRRSMLRTPTA